MKKIKQFILSLLLLSISTIALSSASGVNVKCDIPPLMTELGKDLQDNPEFKNLFVRSSAKEAGQFAEVWNELQKKGRPKMRVNKDYIEYTAKQVNSSPFNDDSGLRADYLKIVVEYRGTLTENPSGDHKYLPKYFKDYFEALKTYTEKFKNVAGFELPAYPNQAKSQDGLYLSLRYMNKTGIQASEIRRLDAIFEQTEGGCPNCRFDVELKNGRLIEFKSYLQPSKIPLPQFITYIASVNKIKNLTYVFNKHKLKEPAEADSVALEKAKAGMKTFLTKNREAVFEAMTDGMKGELGFLPGAEASDFSNAQIEQMVTAIVEVF